MLLRFGQVVIDSLMVAFFLVIPINAVNAFQKSKPRAGAGAESQKAKVQLRKQKAIAILNECADSAASVNDLFYRARIESQIADTFWSIDPERSRVLFRAAWETAKKSDAADFEESQKANQNSAADRFIEARNEVLRAVALRDHKLFDSLAAEFASSDSESQDRSQTGNKAGTDPWHSVSIGGRRRLDLASTLLAEGEAESAAQVAQPVLSEGTSADTVAFIIALRAENAAAADSMLGQLLAITATDPSSDANSVLLLTAPLVSPTMLVVVDASGSTAFRSLTSIAISPRAQNPIPADLQSAILSTSAEILLRRSSQVLTDGGGRTAVAYFFALSRLMPLFDSAAAQLSPALQARQSELASSVQDNVKGMLTSQASLTTVAQQQGDPLKGQVDELAHAGDSATRDRIALGIIKSAVRNRFWDRARRTTTVISDPLLRRASISFITISEIGDIMHAYQDDKENDYEHVLRYLRNSGAPSFALAWGYAQTSEIAARKSGVRRAISLIDEGETLAAQAPAGTREQLLAYEALTLAAVKFNKSRVNTLLREIVRTANSIEDFRGDEEELDLMDGGSTNEKLSVDISSIRLETVFSKVAQLDFEEAATQARALESPIPRLLSLNAVAKTVLAP
jgi:hypothetical protein